MGQKFVDCLEILVLILETVTNKRNCHRRVKMGKGIGLASTSQIVVLGNVLDMRAQIDKTSIK